MAGLERLAVVRTGLVLLMPRRLEVVRILIGDLLGSLGLRVLLGDLLGLGLRVLLGDLLGSLT